MQLSSMNFVKLRVALIACLALCGCGRSANVAEVQSLPVTGKVTLDGKPLAGAIVVFRAPDPPAAFSGMTEENGKYALQGRKDMAENLKGSCKVTISRMVKPDGSLLAEDEMPAMVQATEELPAKYSMLDATELSAEGLTPEGGTFDFELTSN